MLVYNKQKSPMPEEEKDMGDKSIEYYQLLSISSLLIPNV